MILPNTQKQRQKNYKCKARLSLIIPRRLGYRVRFCSQKIKNTSNRKISRKIKRQKIKRQAKETKDVYDSKKLRLFTQVKYRNEL